MWEWSIPTGSGFGRGGVRKMANIIDMDGAKEPQLFQTKRHLFKMSIPLFLNFLLLDIEQIIIFFRNLLKPSSLEFTIYMFYLIQVCMIIDSSFIFPALI